MIVVLVVLIALGIGYVVYASSKPELSATTEPLPSHEELLQARLDLQRVESDVALALTKHEVDREAERIKQAIADALDDER